MKKAPKTLILLFLIVTFGIMNASNMFSQTGHWEELHPLNSPPRRFGSSMASIVKNKVLLFGGQGDGIGSYEGNYEDTWIYDFERNNWFELKPKISPPRRSYHNMCKLSDNIVLLYGGMISESKYYNDTWIFNLIDSSWTKLELVSSPYLLSHFGLTQISENIALLFGGRKFENASIINNTWIFDYGEKKWEQISFDPTIDPRPSPREDPVLSQIKDNKVLLHGGYWYGNLIDTWIFDLNTKKWRKVNATGMTDSLASAGNCDLIPGKVIVFGGDNWGGSGSNHSWIYNITDSTWTLLKLDSMPSERMYTNLAKLEDGKVLLFGGYFYQGGKSDTWIFTLDSMPSTVVDNQENPQFISPNPATDFIEISDINPMLKHGVDYSNIKIFNVLGEIQTTPSLRDTPPWKGGEKVQIDVSGLAPGMYFVRIGDRVGKFVKM